MESLIWDNGQYLNFMRVCVMITKWSQKTNRYCCPYLPLSLCPIRECQWKMITSQSERTAKSSNYYCWRSSYKLLHNIICKFLNFKSQKLWHKVRWISQCRNEDNGKRYVTHRSLYQKDHLLKKILPSWTEPYQLSIVQFLYLFTSSHQTLFYTQTSIFP